MANPQHNDSPAVLQAEWLHLLHEIRRPFQMAMTSPDLVEAQAAMDFVFPRVVQMRAVKTALAEAAS